MELNSVGTIIAMRELELAGGKKVTIIIGKPEKFPDFEDYYCPYHITGMGNERISYAGGVDGIQALLLALNKIGADLYTSKEAEAGILSWKGGEKGNLGFPVSKVLRDMLPDSDS